MTTPFASTVCGWCHRSFILGSTDNPLIHDQAREIHRLRCTASHHGDERRYPEPRRLDA